MLEQSLNKLSIHKIIQNTGGGGYPEMFVKETLARDLEIFLFGNSKVRFSGYFFHSHDKFAFLSGFHHVKIRLFIRFCRSTEKFYLEFNSG